MRPPTDLAYVRLRVVAWRVLWAVVGSFEIIYGFLESLEIGEVTVENVPVYIRRFFDDKTRVMVISASR